MLNDKAPVTVETFYSLIAFTILEHGPMCVSELYKAILAESAQKDANQKGVLLLKVPSLTLAGSCTNDH
ncbi:MAG: hypothetical protein E6Q06_01810 [Candidatus Moraniibacteriota bacterium]|nr:MAG: hypothetical protein E6Q06_01810 [Candidatus Moranbacteria bacterium]